MCGSSTTTDNTSNQTQSMLDPNQYQLGYAVSDAAKQYIRQDPYQGYSGPTQGSFGNTWNVAGQAANSQLNAGANPDYSASSGNLATGTGIAAKTASTPISDLMSNYTSAALDPTLQSIYRQGAQQNAATSAGATMAGAFGDTGYGAQKANNSWDLSNALSGATANAYNTAYNNAYQTQQGGLSSLFSGAQGQTANASGQSGAMTSIDQLLASMGSTEQSANQTGINTAINVNQQNQMGELQQLGLAGAAGTAAPHNTYSQAAGTDAKTQPDNSGIGAIGSIVGGLI